MEEHYDVRLFTRKPSLRLTFAGELLLEHAKQSLYQEERLLAELSNIRSHQKGRIQVGITPTRAPIFFPLIFSRFNKLHPLVELSLREDNTSFLLKDLTDGRIDFLIGVDETLQSRVIASTTLLRDRKLYFLASPKLLNQFGFTEHRTAAALENGVSLSEIQTVPIILNPIKSRIHAQILQEYRKLKTKPKIVIESSNIFPLLPLCGAGNAGLFMSQTILKYVREHYPAFLNSVLTFKIQDLPINCDISLIHFCDKPISVHFDDFIEITKNVFAEYAVMEN